MFLDSPDCELIIAQWTGREGPKGRLSNHQPFCLGYQNSPLSPEPDPGPIDVVVGALLEIFAAKILDDARGAADTFHKSRIEAGKLTRFGDHFIWAIFEEKHCLSPVLSSEE